LRSIFKSVCASLQQKKRKTGCEKFGNKKPVYKQRCIPTGKAGWNPGQGCARLPGMNKNDAAGIRIAKEPAFAYG